MDRSGNITNNQKKIWDRVFKMDHTIFNHKKIVFDYRILTDGLGASLQFIARCDLPVKNLKKAKMIEACDRARKVKKGELEPKKKPEKVKKEFVKKENKIKKGKKSDWPYLEDLNKDETDEIRKGYLVADPGKNNLLYLMSNSSKFAFGEVRFAHIAYTSDNLEEHSMVNFEHIHLLSKLSEVYAM